MHTIKVWLDGLGPYYMAEFTSSDEYMIFESYLGETPEKAVANLFDLCSKVD